jgi:hypothetical protein
VNSAVADSEIAAVIAEHLGELRKRGVLSARPGYQAVGGWPTRKPAIVVTVEHKSDQIPPGERLPETLGGFAVDVREASPLKLLEVTDPARYEAVAGLIPPELRVARFPDELPVEPVEPAPAVLPAAAARRPKPKLPYAPPAGVDLTPVEDDFTITCHASPDAGWPTLSAFLAGTEQRLTVGLYDFTSEHVLTAVESALDGKRLDLVLDHPAPNPTADQTDEDTKTALAHQLGKGLHFAWALEGSDPFAGAAIFPNAYHIKVAVRDKKAFWLSSGNWNNSNQPAIDPIANPDDAKEAIKSDRDWHVIVEHDGLAETVSAYLENDLLVALAHQASDDSPAAQPLPAFAGRTLLETAALEAEGLAPASFAKFFRPRTFRGRMRIRPLLTPDAGIYSSAVLDLVRSAKQSLYIQTQYAHPSSHPEDQAFTDLLEAVAERQSAGVDVRVIFSQWETTPYLEKLQAAGFDLAQVRIQRGVHNKGIVRDGKAVLISSQNWSADGVLRNRDAGVIIEHRGIARYFQQIFSHDWTNLARQTALES